jgi:hypothetical protein
MKTSACLAGFLLLTGFQPAVAQELAKSKYRHNPAYSVNNYKQPHQATVAKKTI